MKQTLLTSLVVVLGSSLTAQPILQSTAIHPVSGENFQYINAQHVSQGTAGGGQAWNLTTMSGSAVGITNVVGPGLTSNGSSFPAATVAWDNQVDSTSHYFKTSSASLQNVGEFKNSWVMVYGDPEDLLRFPFNYTDTYSDTWDNQYQKGNYNFYQRGITTVVYDGYGTLTTPEATYQNVVRVKFTRSYIDSTFQINTPMVTNNVYTEYKWYKSGIHHPIAGVYTNNNNITGLTSGGYYMSESVSTNNLDGLVANLSIFPNPCDQHLNVSFSLAKEKEVQVKVYNTLGAIVKVIDLEKGIVGNNNQTIDVAELPSGVYFAQVVANQEVAATKRFVVTK